MMKFVVVMAMAITKCILMMQNENVGAIRERALSLVGKVL